MTPLLSSILILEDSGTFREILAMLIKEAGYEVVSRGAASDALADIKARLFDLMLIDHELPGMNGSDFLAEARRHQPDVEAIFITGTLKLEDAIRISQRRVAAIFPKPPEPAALLKAVAEAVANSQKTRASLLPHAAAPGALPESPPAGSASPVASRADDRSPEAGAPVFTPRHFPANSPAFELLGRQLLKFCDFRSVILLKGETGSMFEEIARDLTENSTFREGCFLLIPSSLFQPATLTGRLSALFGSTDLATVVLTGVGEFDHERQALLEKFLSATGPFMPFAGRYRVLACADHGLTQRVESGDFDEDLYFRFSALSITLPPLVSFQADFARLTRHLLATARPPGARPLGVAADAITFLDQRLWPGDYAEFRGLILAASRLEQTDALTASSLLQASRGEAPAAPAETPAPAALAETDVGAVEPAAPSSAPASDAEPVPISVEPTPPVTPAPPAAVPVPAPPPSPEPKPLRAYNFNQRLAQTLAKDASAPVVDSPRPHLRRHA